MMKRRVKEWVRGGEAAAQSKLKKKSSSSTQWIRTVCFHRVMLLLLMISVLLLWMSWVGLVNFREVLGLFLVLPQSFAVNDKVRVSGGCVHACEVRVRVRV